MPFSCGRCEVRRGVAWRGSFTLYTVIAPKYGAVLVRKTSTRPNHQETRQSDTQCRAEAGSLQKYANSQTLVTSYSFIYNNYLAESLMACNNTTQERRKINIKAELEETEHDSSMTAPQ